MTQRSLCEGRQKNVTKPLPTDITWIGGQIHITHEQVTVSIPPVKVRECLGLVKEILKAKVVAIRMLRTLAGTASYFASMVYVWRPVLFELWGTLKKEKNRAVSRTAPEDACG